MILICDQICTGFPTKNATGFIATTAAQGVGPSLRVCVPRSTFFKYALQGSALVKRDKDRLRIVKTGTEWSIWVNMGQRGSRGVKSGQGLSQRLIKRFR